MRRDARADRREAGPSGAPPVFLAPPRRRGVGRDPGGEADGGGFGSSQPSLAAQRPAPVGSSEDLSRRARAPGGEPPEAAWLVVRHRAGRGPRVRGGVRGDSSSSTRPRRSGSSRGWTGSRFRPRARGRILPPCNS
jgi:hypothetical protein